MRQNKLTLEQALQLTEHERPIWDDHADGTIEEWRDHLAADGRKKVTDNTFVNDCSHCFLISKYENGRVRSWRFSRIA